MWRQKVIPHFAPNTALGKQLSWKRLRSFSLWFALMILVEVSVLIICHFFANKETSAAIGIMLSALNIVETATCLAIFDNGAANRLKKARFEINGQSVKNGHTYYYALKFSGFCRLAINVAGLTIVIAVALTLYLV